ncbi:MAG TPA: cell division protein ZapA, partial [Clostridia bacterium]|nr:cell division protein ZapA [Clostridia bacterium]
MPDDKRVEKVKVEIYGEQYILKGDASPEYMEMLADYVNEKMNYVAERSVRLPSSKVAILTAINIADDLMKLRKENSKMLELLNGSGNNSNDVNNDVKDDKDDKDDKKKN